MYKNKKMPVIVAELSGNHNGSLNRAIELMELAHECGADAVKIQTYTENSLTLDSDRPEFKLEGGLWGGQTYYELYKKAKTPREWMKPLFNHAKAHGIFLFSSPFSYEDVDCLEEAGCPVYKIASYELNDIGLIDYCASKGKPMVMSTGLATLEEIDRAVDVVRKSGIEDLTLLHCESRYPADPEKFNLNSIPYLKERYQKQVFYNKNDSIDEVERMIDEAVKEVLKSTFKYNVEKSQQPLYNQERGGIGGKEQRRTDRTPNKNKDESKSDRQDIRDVRHKEITNEGDNEYRDFSRNWNDDNRRKNITYNSEHEESGKQRKLIDDAVIEKAFKDVINKYGITTEYKSAGWLANGLSIISYQNVVGNYNNITTGSSGLSIISYQNPVGNYNFGAFLQFCDFVYFIKSNNDKTA